MTRRSTSLFALALATALLVAAAPRTTADIVRTKDGRSLEGKVVEEDANQIKLLTARGAVTLKRADVADIVRQKSSIDVLQEKLLALTPSDPALYLDTGKWCLAELKREDLGTRLITISMALDPQAYTAGMLYLGDYYLKERRDKNRAATYFMRALQADPNNQDCTDRLDQVKDATAQVLREDDQNLRAGLEALHKDAFEDALKALTNGKRSSLRPRCEQLMGVPLTDVIAYCESRLVCKTCKGSHEQDCADCKGKKAKECKVCGGSGVRRQMSSKGTTEFACKECEGWGNILCKKCAASRTAPPGTKASPEYAVLLNGGKVRCHTCKGKDPVQRSEPPRSGVAGALAYLERRLGGTLTISEQMETRMVRVGGVAQVPGADEFLAKPVWSGEEWVTVEERQAADPTFRVKSGTEEDAFAEVRKAGTPLNTNADGVAQFVDQIRQTFGVGPVSPTVAQQTYMTDFSTRPPESDRVNAGPYLEVDAADGVLRPYLLQLGQEFSTVRVSLGVAGATGIPIPRSVDLARLCASGATVRLYYSVADSKEDIEPQTDRDISVHHFTVRVLLVDFLDPSGKLAKSTR